MAETADLHLDVEGALKRVGNDRDLLRELYDAFLGDAPNKVRLLKQALKDKDMPLVVKQAHSLKGASAAIGAVECRRLAEALEMAGRSQDGEEAGLLLTKVLHEVGLVLGMISGRIF